ncbi:MAG: hypothetical protein DCC67_20510 [Planctomycetota bacterium]|nr:MAG: hypothetical protein DCC67_20510 [Planctomycetota bacterium]
MDTRSVCPFARLTSLLGAVGLVAAGAASAARAQDVYYAGIAYSQSTGKIGYTVRQARTEESAKQLAAAYCGTPDAKTYIWGPNQWVAIAIVEGRVGTAGFGRGPTSDEAQRKALAECKARARGAACRVALCVHSDGTRTRELRSSPADPAAPTSTPPAPDVARYAAIAFSPSTGKIGHTAGKARTKEEAQQLALKDCGVRDARVFMWGNQWVAVAVCDQRRGVAGFAPGATRDVAEKQALAECQKRARGAPCRVALAVHASGQQPPDKSPAPPQPGAAAATTATRSGPAAPAVAPASATTPPPAPAADNRGSSQP